MEKKPTMNSKELVRVLPSAVGDIIQNIYERYADHRSDVRHLLNAQTQFTTMVATGEESHDDTQFWNALTYSYRRHPSQIQFDAIQYYLGIRLGEVSDDKDLQRMYRFKKREFLKRFYRAAVGDPTNDSLSDQDLDDVLDLHGERMLQGFSNYKDVITLKWNGGDIKEEESEEEDGPIGYRNGVIYKSRE